MFAALDNLTIFITERLGGVACTISFSVYCFYVQAALLAGCSKIGLSFLTMIPVAQIRLHATWISSFLINLFLVLVSNHALIHFCAVNLPRFTEGTRARFLFKTMISSTPAFKWAFQYKIFEILILVLGVLSWVFLFLWRNFCAGWGEFKLEDFKIKGLKAGLGS